MFKQIKENLRLPDFVQICTILRCKRGIVLLKHNGWREREREREREKERERMWCVCVCCMCVCVCDQMQKTKWFQWWVQDMLKVGGLNFW